MIQRLYKFFMLVAFFLGISQVSFAYNEYLKKFRDTYPKAKKIISCTLCHEESYTLNSYGMDFYNAKFNFRTIETKDSNKNKINNRAEILQDKFPGSRIEKNL